jgi:hypothetical protein
MTDPFPLLTAFLENTLLYLIYIGVILATISAVLAGILFLPIFGLTNQRAALGSTALRMTVIGIVVILLAVPVRNAMLGAFPTPVNLPPIPLTSPTVSVPTPTRVPSTPTRVP